MKESYILWKVVKRERNVTKIYRKWQAEMEEYSTNLWSTAGFTFALNFKISVWVIMKSPSHKIQTSTTKTNFV